MLEKKAIKAIEYDHLAFHISASGVIARTTLNQNVPNKPNATADVVPFDNNIDFGDDVPDFDLDLLQMISQVEEQEKANVQVTPTTTTTTKMTSIMSSNVLNNVPKSLLHNCTIQNITFNMPK